MKVAAEDLDTDVKILRKWLTADDKPFDTALSYKIYQSTFSAIADKIGAKKRLSLITNGALTSLPTQLLITSDPTGKTLKNQDWLVRGILVGIVTHNKNVRLICGPRRVMEDEDGSKKCQSDKH